MNLKELKESLTRKINCNYFKIKLFKVDKEIYARRSFDDLFTYYKQRKVTEKMLLQALYECKFSASVCHEIKKVVFFKYYKQENTFWNNKFTGGYDYTHNTKDTKYTSKYLNKLFKTIY